MQILPFSPEEVRFLKELNKRKVPFIVVGLSAAALQGAPVVTKDVDIWFKDIGAPELLDAFRRCGVTYIPPINLNPPIIAGKGIEFIDVVTHVHGVGGFDVEYRKCVTVKAAGLSLKVLPLERIIKSKKFLKRQKDMLVLPVLEDTVAAAKGRRKK